MRLRTKYENKIHKNYTNSIKLDPFEPMRARTSTASFPDRPMWIIVQDMWHLKTWRLSLRMFLNLHRALLISLNHWIALTQSNSKQNWEEEDHQEASVSRRPSLIARISVRTVESTETYLEICKIELSWWSRKIPPIPLILDSAKNDPSTYFW